VISKTIKRKDLVYKPGLTERNLKATGRMGSSTDKAK
jgi:hypothetical protein